MFCVKHKRNVILSASGSPGKYRLAKQEARLPWLL
jgi:hypothetical protein